VVLDAAVIIALLDDRDVHHGEALALLRATVGIPKLMSALNYAEALVGPVRHDRLPEAQAAMDALRIRQVPVDDAARLAAIRAQTTSKMPDCCVLLAAEQHRAAVATFDRRLQRSARMLGLAVA